MEEYVEKPRGFWNPVTHRFEYERLSGEGVSLHSKLTEHKGRRNLDDPDLNSDDDVPEQEEVLKANNFGFVRGIKNETFLNLKKEKKKHVTLEVLFCLTFLLSMWNEDEFFGNIWKYLDEGWYSEAQAKYICIFFWHRREELENFCSGISNYFVPRDFIESFMFFSGCGCQTEETFSSVNFYRVFE